VGFRLLSADAEFLDRRVTVQFKRTALVQMQRNLQQRHNLLIFLVTLLTSSHDHQIQCHTVQLKIHNVTLAERGSFTSHEPHWKNVHENKTICSKLDVAKFNAIAYKGSRVPDKKHLHFIHLHTPSTLGTRSCIWHVNIFRTIKFK